MLFTPNRLCGPPPLPLHAIPDLYMPLLRCHSSSAMLCGVGTLPSTMNGETDVLSGLLRRYLRELPEPLLPVSFFKTFLTTLTSSKKFKNGKDRGGVEAVKTLVEGHDFPPVNYHALRRVCGLLKSMLTSWWSDSSESDQILDIVSLNIMRPDNLKRTASSQKELNAIKDAVSNLILHSAAIFVKSTATDSQARRISMIKRGEKASRHQLLDIDDLATSAGGPESARSRRMSSFSVTDASRIDAELRAEFRAYKDATTVQIQTLVDAVEALRSEVDTLRKRLVREGSDTFASAHGSDLDDSESPPSTPTPRSDSTSKLNNLPKKKSSGRSLDGVERKSSKSSIDTGLTSKRDSKRSLKG